MEGLQIKNIEATNLDELKKLIESTLKAVEAVEENLEKINNFEIKVIQKSSCQQGLNLHFRSYQTSFRIWYFL